MSSLGYFLFHHLLVSTVSSQRQSERRPLGLPPLLYALCSFSRGDRDVWDSAILVALVVCKHGLGIPVKEGMRVSAES